MTLLTVPRFTQRVPILFLCPDNNALSLDGINNPVVANNPSVFTLQVGTVAKIDLGLNGTTYFRGDGEYAPFALQLEWKYLGYTDYLRLAALRPYFVNFVSYRNVGYYGKLVMTDPVSVTGTGDAVSTKGIFYVLNPSDAGGASAVARLRDPSYYSPYVTTASQVGYLPNGISQHYRLSFSSVYGETPSTYVGYVTPSSSSTANIITWNWPTDTGYVTKASIYVNNDNNTITNKLLAEVFNGLTPSFIDVGGLAQATITQNPVSSNTAYRGYWSSGIWINEA